MKQLDDFIRQHAAEFDLDEPNGDHFGRFSSRLQRQPAYKKYRWLPLWAKIAAIILFMVALTYVAVKPSRLMNEWMQLTVYQPALNEIREAERYYTHEIDQYYAKIRELDFDNDSGEKQRVLDELLAMDDQVRALKRDLKRNPDDERIKYAIINFYQVKIDLMATIIARTKHTELPIM